MSEPHQVPSSESWLTPTATGIAALTIAVLSLLSNNTTQAVVQGWINRNGPGAFSDVITLSGLAQTALAVIALLLAKRALDSAVPTARNLGGAAAVLGGLGLVMAVLMILVGIAGM